MRVKPLADWQAASAWRERREDAGEMDTPQRDDGQTPTTEAQIVASRIGPPEVIDGPIILGEYDPAWPGLFEREAARINDALGHRMVQIEHVGSTSVPGLAAKPR